MTVRLTDGTERIMPTGYLDAGHLDHGYAMTIHKAQGLTADEALVLATDDLYREAAYTALSRAHLDTCIYVARDEWGDDLLKEMSHASPPRDAPTLSMLAGWVGRSRTDNIAIDSVIR